MPKSTTDWLLPRDFKILGVALSERQASAVSHLTSADLNPVDDYPDAASTRGKKLAYTLSSLAQVEAVNAERSEENRKK